MAELRFTKDHEWIRVGDGDVYEIGISDYAQGQLGDVVFVELPEIGKKIAKGGQAAVVESVKAASDVYSPVAGEVVAINDALTGDPGLVNKEPTGAGWFFKLKTGDTAQFAELMDQGAYDAYVKGLG
ncbi:MAG: glycine cleavage system protein GcvH [Tagaea sp.]|jgi:glycine cleavage system H protein|nr:glycine cleavage system protein GcvH [Azospirillum sp.]MCA3267465.1 glycine cleavage system protein GcvH [Azospirillum sp.]